MLAAMNGIVFAQTSAVPLSLSWVLCSVLRKITIAFYVRFFWYSLLHQYTHALRNVNQLVRQVPQSCLCQLRFRFGIQRYRTFEMTLFRTGLICTIVITVIFLRFLRDSVNRASKSEIEESYRKHVLMLCFDCSHNFKPHQKL